MIQNQTTVGSPRHYPCSYITPFAARSCAPSRWPAAFWGPRAAPRIEFRQGTVMWAWHSSAPFRKDEMSWRTHPSLKSGKKSSASLKGKRSLRSAATAKDECHCRLVMSNRAWDPQRRTRGQRLWGLWHPGAAFGAGGVSVELRKINTDS